MVDVRDLLEGAAPEVRPIDVEAIRRGAAQRRLRRRRAAGSGVVLVLLTLGTVVWASARDRDQPAESRVATTPDTASREPVASGASSSVFFSPCGLTLQATSVPPGFEAETSPGDGVGSGAPAAIAHWRGGTGRYVNILEPDDGRLPVPEPEAGAGVGVGGDTKSIPVLGVTGQVRAIDDGYGIAVVFSGNPPCGFPLTGYGITQDELADLAETLYSTTPSGSPSFDANGALWPEASALDVPDVGTLTGAQAWRLSAEETAVRYGRDLFRSRDVSLDVDGGEPSEDGRNGVVLGIRSGDKSATVKLTRAVGDRWFSVYEAIVPFRPTAAPPPGQDGCPVLVDVGGRRWTTDPANPVPDEVLQDSQTRVARKGFSEAELRLRERRYGLVSPSEDSGNRCGF